jgi:hypothetical protein
VIEQTSRAVLLPHLSRALEKDDLLSLLERDRTAASG